jgi:hypothetical protein
LLGVRERRQSGFFFCEKLKRGTSKLILNIPMIWVRSAVISCACERDWPSLGLITSIGAEGFIVFVVYGVELLLTAERGNGYCSLQRLLF